MANEANFFGAKLLVLRLHRLGHIPPAVYATEILLESGIKAVVVEYGYLHEDQTFVHGPIPRRRFATPAARFVPRILRSLMINSFMAVRLLVCFAREGRPKLMMAHGLPEQTVAWIVSVLAGVPYVVDVHEVYESAELSPMNRLYFAFEGPALRRAKCLIFPERTRAAVYRDRYRLRQPIFIVANCTRLRDMPGGVPLRRQLGFPGDSVIFGYMGGIGPLNMIEELITAVSRRDNACLVIWGWGDDDYLVRLKKVIAALHAENRVRMLGTLSPEDKWGYLKGCDVSCCIYRPDILRLKHAATASNKLMEAIACGVPVIASDGQDFKDIVEKYDIGVCADPLTDDGLAKAVAGIAGAEQERRIKGENARALFESTFNYEKQFAPALAEISALMKA